MKGLVSVYINGVWSVPNRPDEGNTTNDLVIYEIGELYIQCSESKYSELYNNGYFEDFDCFLCPEMFSNPEWSGIIRFIND
jgi:hypothetical protein